MAAEKTRTRRQMSSTGTGHQKLSARRLAFLRLQRGKDLAFCAVIAGNLGEHFFLQLVDRLACEGRFGSETGQETENQKEAECQQVARIGMDGGALKKCISQWINRLSRNAPGLFQYRNHET